jgi:hypothetical protein
MRVNRDSVQEVAIAMPALPDARSAAAAAVPPDSSCPGGADPGTWRTPKEATRAVFRLAIAVSAAAGFAVVAGAGTPAGASPPPFLSNFHKVTNVGSTVPGNDDENPYGIVEVPQTVGKLVAGDTLISNFNNDNNVQGTGTTIVEMSRKGSQTLFAQIDASTLPGPCPGGVGLTTALTVVGDGFVIVGSLPVNDVGAPQPGCLIVLDNEGVPVETFSGNGINGPWDLTTARDGFLDQLFVTNVLNNTVLSQPTPDGTVLRLDLFDFGDNAPVLVDTTEIGTGFGEQLNGQALVIGPTGDALGVNDTLYVADTLNNRISAIPEASTRSDAANAGADVVTQNGSLNGPLGMTLAPDGDIITVNGGDANGVETTPAGAQVDTVQFDPLGEGGDLFGITNPRDGRSLLFVDDGDNTLKRIGPG